MLTPDDADFPELLRHISGPPSVLYCRGELADPRTTAALVGSRTPTEETLEAAASFGYLLSASGIRVVSGGALGIDAAALRGALRAVGSRPVSVLPVSLDSGYVIENARLRRDLLDRGGALVSEYFSQKNPDRGAFHARNRLITGLSRGVVLFQAAKKSGTMLYARFALEQDRDVFVYPGPEGSEKFAGSAQLLEEGAIEARDASAVVREYGGRPLPIERDRQEPPRPSFAPRPPQTERAPALRDAGKELPPETEAVLAALGADPLSVTELAERTKLPAGRLLSLLTELELEGMIESHPGKRYSRKY